MRSRFVILFLTALIGLAAWTPVGAQTGDIIVDVYEAHAQPKEKDACVCFIVCICNEQDFWVQTSFPPYTIWNRSTEIGNRDHAAWSPVFSTTGTVSKLRRFHDLKVELWDGDDTTPSDRFDISRDPGHDELAITFDVCTQTWIDYGQSTTYGPGIAHPPFGTRDPEFNGRVVLDIYAEGRVPFTANDLSITGLDPVQVAFDPEYVVSNKATAMRVRLSSTYTDDVGPAPVTVNVTDGISTWVQTRNLTVAPGVSTFYFFDGMNGTPPFQPNKPINVDRAWITYSGLLNFNEMAPPGTPPDLLDCYQANNSIFGKQSPIARTKGPSVLFVPYDFVDSVVALSSFSDVLQTAQQDEQFRRTTWPLAQTNWNASVLPILSLWNPIDPFTWFTEPYRELALQSLAAGLLGVDRLVLVPRKGWFTDNQFRSGIWPKTSVGLSVGSFGPHAVIAEANRYAVSTHELGHTLDLSQRKCANDPANVGCRDEYKHKTTDGWPYVARGLDVEGTIFPAGAADMSSFYCSAVQPGTREVCQLNIMDRQSGASAVNWTDTFTENFLTIQRFKESSDPELISLGGVVHSVNGIDPNYPPTFEGRLEFSYHTFGFPDVEDPPAGSAPGSYGGHGPFSVRLQTASGERVYRFAPEFYLEGQSTPQEGAYFSFFVPWDPTTQGMALYAPMNLWEDCENGTCDEVMIFNRSINPGPIRVDTLRAGRDTSPPLTGPPPAPPTIGPGHEAVLAWSASQPVPGPEGLRTILYLSHVNSAGGPEQWLPYTISNPGSEFHVPQEWLAAAPGDYMGQVVVSNGLLSAPLTGGMLFHVCNYTNGGVEVCNGIDDDCDGVVDNGVNPGPTNDVRLNPQPLPPGGGPADFLLEWTADPLAQSYDVVYGDLATLTGSGGEFSLAVLGCLAENTAGTSVDSQPGPIGGQAVFYLVRGNNCIGAGTWNESTPGPPSQPDRDPGINASTLSCRP